MSDVDVNVVIVVNDDDNDNDLDVDILQHNNNNIIIITNTDILYKLIILYINTIYLRINIRTTIHNWSHIFNHYII